MRSNGITHVCNDTFVAATADTTHQLHFFTGSFAKEDRWTSVDLCRPVRVLPHEALACTAAEVQAMVASLRRRATAEVAAVEERAALSSTLPPAPAGDDGKRRAHPTLPAKSTPVPRDAGDLSSDDDGTTECDLSRHRLLASCDGRRVVAVSNHHRQHYVFDLTMQPMAVAAFETPEVLRSVSWHPTHPYLLLSLSVTGVFAVYDTSATHLDIVFLRVQHVNLRAVVHAMRCDKTGPDASEDARRRHLVADVLADHQEKKHPTATVAVDSETSSNDEAARGTGALKSSTDAAATFPRRRGMELNYYGLPVSRHAWTSIAGDAAVRKASPGPAPATAPLALAVHRESGSKKEERRPAQPHAASETHGSDTALRQASPTVFAHLPRRGRKALIASFQPFAHQTMDADDEKPRSAQLVVARSSSTAGAAAAGPLALMFPDTEACEDPEATSPLDLVDMCVVSPTVSLPATLLVLSSSGDVYALKLTPYGMPAIGDIVLDDGRVPVSRQTLLRDLGDAHTFHLTPQVHHLIQGGGAANGGALEEDALAVRCCCADTESGLHVVLVCCSSGVLRGAYVDEPDLISRHRTLLPSLLPRQGAATITVHFGPTLLARSFLSPAVPTTTHTIDMSMVGNVCMLRYGDVAYVIAVPVWDVHRGGWSYYSPTAGLSSADRQRHEAMRLPLLSQEAAVPPPLMVRVPFAVKASSVGIGATEVVIVPESSGSSRHIISVKIATLLRSAMLARSGVLRFTPAPPKTSCSADLLDRVVVCHQYFLSGLPSADVDGVTTDLAAGVEAAVATVAAQERAVQMRQSALAERLQQLATRVERANARCTAHLEEILQAIVVRRGPEAIVTGNERLGQIHEILTEFEEAVTRMKKERTEGATGPVRLMVPQRSA